MAGAFKTGFGAMLGVLFAILLFPFIIIGGCLLTVGSCGIAAVSTLPKSESSSAPTPSPVSEPKLSDTVRDPDFEYELIKSTNGDKDGGHQYYPLYYVEKPTKTSLAKLAQMIKAEQAAANDFILAEFYDNKACTGEQAGRYLHDYSQHNIRGNHGSPKTDILVFRQNVSMGDTTISGEAAEWLKSSTTLLDDDKLNAEMDAEDAKASASKKTTLVRRIEIRIR